jgi:4-amino-4-deoxy-L-arabinose transferase-like glycosyltransferase
MNAMRSYSFERRLSPASYSLLLERRLSRTAYWVSSAILGAVGAFLLFFRLGQASLNDWDEAIYADIARTMARDGHWMTMRWMGHLWFEKPPLLMWCMATSFKIFGTTEFAARLFPALCGLGLILLMPWFGKLLRNYWIGMAAGVMLLLTNEVLFRSRFGTMDIPLTFFLFLAFYAFLKLEPDHPRYWLLVGAALGLAYLVKGAAAGVGPMVMAIAIVLDGRDRIKRTLRSSYFWGGVGITLALILPWHLIMQVRYGKEFWDTYLGYQVLTRMTALVNAYYHGGRFFYYTDLQANFYPWFFPALLAMPVALRDAFRERSPVARLLLLVVGVVFATYTFVHTKNPWYVVPLYPALALLTAEVMYRAIVGSDLASLGALILGGILDCLIVPAPLVLIFLAGAVAAYLILKHERKLAASAVAGIVAAGIAVAAVGLLPPLYRGKETSQAHFAKMIREEFGDDQAPMVIFAHPYGGGTPGPSIAYYAQRPIEWDPGPDPQSPYLQGGEQHDVFLASKDLPEFEERYDFSTLASYGPFIYGRATSKSEGAATAKPSGESGKTRHLADTDGEASGMASDLSSGMTSDVASTLTADQP